MKSFVITLKTRWIVKYIQSNNFNLNYHNKNGYSLCSFREKLKNRYKDHIYFAKGEGSQSDLVCFKNMADYHREMKFSTKENVLKAAAKIIKAEIRDLNVTKTHYQNADDIMDEIKGYLARTHSTVWESSVQVTSLYKDILDMYRG